MTFLELISAMRRWWVAVIVGLLLAGGAAVFLVRPEIVYTGQVDVLLTLPMNDDYPNSYQAQTPALIATAGVIADDINGAARDARTASTGVTLAGRGVEDGWSVVLPNAGGQWVDDYEEARLAVEATAPTPGAVQARLDALVSRVRADLTKREDQAGVSAANRIRVLTSPKSPQIIGDPGRPSQARAAALVLGVALTVGAVAALDRWKRRPLARRPRKPTRQILT